MSRRRDVEPPIYNEGRLEELPIPQLNDIGNRENPNIEHQNDVQNESETFAQMFTVLADGNEHEVEIASDEQTQKENPSAGQPSTAQNLTVHDDENQDSDTEQRSDYGNLFEQHPEDEIHHETDDNHATDPLLIDSVQFKHEYSDLVENHAGNSDDIDRLLDIDECETLVDNEESETYVEDVFDDDLTFLVGKSGIPKPQEVHSTLIKRENDPLSGCISYDDTVSRLYLKSVCS